MIVILAASFLTQTLSQSVTVTPTGFDKAKEPQIAIDTDRRVYIAYGMGNALYLSVSENQGKSFSNPVMIGEAGQLSLGMRRGPRITAHQGVLTVSAVYGAKGKGQDGDILAWKSLDRGKTWSKPVRVNDVEGSAREGLHAMAVGPDGTLACTWLDLREKGTTLYLSTSKDGGSTWSANVLAYRSPSGTICECCHPSLAFGLKGRLWIMFRNSLAGARDMYLFSTDDLGKKFTDAQKLGQGTWMLNACPMDGGSLSIDKKGQPYTCWRRENGVFSTSADGTKETSVSPGQQPWAALGRQGPHVMWANRMGISYAPPKGDIVSLTMRGMSPMIASSPDGSLVLGAWTEDGIRACVLETP